MGADIDELTIESAGAAVWLNSVTAVTALEFVAIGGAEINEFTYPFVATFEINPDSTLALKSSAIVDGALGQYGVSVVVDPDRVAGGAFVCYFVAEQPENALGVNAISIHALNGSLIDLTTHTLEWTVDIDRDEPLDLWARIDCLELHSGNIYIAGSTDVDKENNPAGGYWDAGFIGSVSVNGNLNWMKIISISEHSENYYDIYVTDEALFAVGQYGRYVKSISKRQHGLAFFSIFDPETGAEKYHLGLGSHDYSSGINSALVAGSIALCAGWTKFVETDVSYQAWVGQVDIDGLPNTNFIEIPAMPLAEGPVGESNTFHPMEVGR
jgi:hypothetical protein